MQKLAPTVVNARVVMVLIFLWTMASALHGCVEARFALASESRFPIWFAAAETRGQVTLTYLTPNHSSPDAVLEMKVGNGKTLSVRGQACWHPIMRTRGSPDRSSYPMYRYLLADGKVEVIEHRQMEPVFWISDNPRFLKEAREAASCDKG